MPRFFSILRGILFVGALLGVVVFASARPAAAAGVVGNGAPASCTETALNNRLNGGGLVTFNCGANPKTITITTLKQISANTIIDGGNKITLKAQNTYHFQVFNAATFTLKNISLSNSNSIIAGALENFGTTTVINVTFKGNTAVTNGGAIYNLGALMVKKSVFRNNRAANGGAIYNDGGTITIKSSTFDNNEAAPGTGNGGAVANNSGALTLKNSTFTNNRAAEGGALYTNFGSTNTIKKSSFDANQSSDSGGAIDNLGNTTIAASIIKNNTAGNGGGGISHGGTLTMQTTTISGNHAGFGAGMSDFGNSTTILTCTFSGNIATGDGGGIYSFTNTVLRNSTLSGNQAGAVGHGGGGYFQHGSGGDFQFVTIANNKADFGAGAYSDGGVISSIQMENVLLSNNRRYNNDKANCDGASFVSLGGNISNDTHCAAFTQSHDRQNINAKLGPLANNGGPTQTHMLLAGSPAINNGFNIPGITQDQRGAARPQGSAPDTGAVEAQ